MRRLIKRYILRLTGINRTRQAAHFLLVGLAAALLGAGGCAATPPAGEVLSVPHYMQQYSTISALLAGEYDGEWRIAQLRADADFGLGTVNGLAGEMIALEGLFYVADENGRLHVLDAAQRVPFAVVTSFPQNESVSLGEVADSEALQKTLLRLAGNPNVPVAIRIDGIFSRLLLRSERRQTKPYAPLSEVMARDEVQYEAIDSQGTLVGFFTPDYLAGVAIPGFHFHYLSNDRALGGHVLGLRMERGELRMALLSGFQLHLPDPSAFADVDLSKDFGNALLEIEHGQPRQENKAPSGKSGKRTEAD